MKTYLAVAGVSILVGIGGTTWGMAAAGTFDSKPPAAAPMVTPATKTLPVEVVTATAVVGKPLALPNAWATQFSERQLVKLIGQFDSSGPDAWDAKTHPLVYVTTNGPGYAGFLSPTKSPGIAIIDANTYEVIIEKQYRLEGVNDTKYFETHGVGVSYDGKWIYLPTGDTSQPNDRAGRLLIINAQTLKIHQVLQTANSPHHAKGIEVYDGKTVKRLMLIENFNGLNKGSGSAVYVLDPADDNRVVGGFLTQDVQGSPYLAFAHPDGVHLFVGMSPSRGDVRHQVEGMWAVINMTTWQPEKWYKGGYGPIWTAHTADGRFTYLGDGGSDEIFKIDNEAQKNVGFTRNSVHGAYGIHLNWDDKRLITIEKGEGSHNRGHLIGSVDAVGMKPVDSFETSCLRGDHGVLHPDPTKNELWVSYNSNFRDVVFDIGANKVKRTIEHAGSSHNGAFVSYAVGGDGAWTGELLSDQNGLHGSARALKEDNLGVKDIVYGATRTPVSVFR